MRFVLVGLLGLMIAGAAVWIAREEMASEPVVPPLATREAPPAPASAPAPTPAPAPPPQAAAPPPPAPPAPIRSAEPIRPSFDVVRIGVSGVAVLAGRAAPEAEIIIFDGEVEIGRARADRRGEWVFVSATPLRPGGRELSLRARNSDGSVTEAASTVVLVVPEPERDVAGQPAQGQASAPLALLAPRDTQGELRVLQAPAPPAPATAPAPQASSAMPQATSAVPQASAEPRGSAEPQATPAAEPARAEAVPPPAPQPAPPAPAAPPAQIAALSPTPAAPAAAPTPAPTPAPSPAASLPTGRPPGGVSVDAVDYAEGGEVRFAGRAGPGGAVRLYLDNRHIGDAAADDQGRWNLEPETPIAPGTFELRADQVDAAGRVTGRVQMPFQRAATPPQGMGERSIVVQPGNNLWTIARRTYGRGIHYSVIYGANREAIRDPHRIYPGQVFSLPAEVPAP